MRTKYYNIGHMVISLVFFKYFSSFFNSFRTMSDAPTTKGKSIPYGRDPNLRVHLVL